MDGSGTAAPAPSEAGWAKRLESWVSPVNGLIALVLSLGGGVAYAYKHFATADEVGRLAATIKQLEVRLVELGDEASCANAMESEVSRKAVEVSRRVREALRNMQEARDFDGLKLEIKQSVATMDQALGELEAAREQRNNKTLAFKGSERCKR